MTMKIAAFIQTYNEEKRIQYTIEALKKFDEVIISDKSSTDRTCEIARELGAKIIQTEYYDVAIPDCERKKIADFLENEVESEWLFALSTSDIVHYQLYDELIETMQNNSHNYEVVEIPMHKYSMGTTGKNTFIGNIRYEKNVFKKEMYGNGSNPMVHESMFEGKNAIKLIPKDSSIAVYHLTHPNLDIVMDRHWRYAVQYVNGAIERGRDRERVMRYSVNECIRLIYRYFKRGIYKSKEVGKAQLMMLIMYNCMIFLNAFFDKEMEQKIDNKYREIREMCSGKNE